MTGDVEAKALLRAERLAARNQLAPAERIEKSLTIAETGLKELEMEPGMMCPAFSRSGPRRISDR